MSDSTITVVGNVTRQPELKFTTTGKAQTRFSVAVNRNWKNKTTGEWEERVSFFDVSCWGELAENVANSLNQGNRTIITGRLEQRSWETPEGDKRSTVEIIADEVGAGLTFATAAITRTTKVSKPATAPGEEPF
jgi:single-strand DNA-binding protein